MRMAIGPLLKLISLRMSASADQSYGEVMEEIRQKSLLVLANSIPLEVILNEVQVARPSTHTPLTQAFIDHAENNIEDGRPFLGCQMETMKYDLAELPYDTTFTVINNTAGDTHIIFSVQETLYTDGDALLIAHRYEDILQKFATGPDEQIGDQWQFRKLVL